MDMEKLIINGREHEIKLTTAGHPYATSIRGKFISIRKTTEENVFAIWRNQTSFLGYATLENNTLTVN